MPTGKMCAKRCWDHRSAQILSLTALPGPLREYLQVPNGGGAEAFVLTSTMKR